MRRRSRPWNQMRRTASLSAAPPGVAAARQPGPASRRRPLRPAPAANDDGSTGLVDLGFSADQQHDVTLTYVEQQRLSPSTTGSAHTRRSAFISGGFGAIIAPLRDVDTRARSSRQRHSTNLFDNAPASNRPRRPDNAQPIVGQLQISRPIAAPSDAGDFDIRLELRHRTAAEGGTRWCDGSVRRLRRHLCPDGYDEPTVGLHLHGLVGELARRLNGAPTHWFRAEHRHARLCTRARSAAGERSTSTRCPEPETYALMLAGLARRFRRPRASVGQAPSHRPETRAIRSSEQSPGSAEALSVQAQAAITCATAAVSFLP